MVVFTSACPHELRMTIGPHLRSQATRNLELFAFTERGRETNAEALTLISPLTSRKLRPSA
jgi:hypothetical protein